MKTLTKTHCFLLLNFVAIASLEMQALALSFEVPEDNNRPKCFGISRGKRFILGFNDILVATAPSLGLSILVVAFSDQQTTVTVSSKYQVLGKPFQEIFEIEAGGFRRISVPVELIMNGNERSLKAIDVTASWEVSVYGLIYQNYITDGFLSIPTNNIGTQYVVVTLGPSSWLTEFAVIGVGDSTSVTVLLRGAVTFEGITYNAGEVLRFIINELEAVQIQGLISQDLTGSIIQTSKPVAVFSGNECVNHPGSFCDIVTEQLVPVKSWGQRHIYTAAQSTDSNIYRLVAYFSQTNLTIPGVEDQSLEPGEFWEGRLSGSGLVTSNKPTLMLQHLASVNGKTVDPSLIQVPAEEQYGFLFGFTTPPRSAGGGSDGFLNFISIVVRVDGRQTVYLNGSPINNTLAEIEVPNTNYISLTVQLPRGEGVYFVEQMDPESSPLSVIVYGYERYETYGYAAGLSLPSNEQLLRLTRYYFRELGGEVFTVTVPCLQTNSLSFQNAKCKFSTGFGDVEVAGERTDSYTVICITPTFYKNGLTSVYVSLDDGKSFPYSGIVYVASEEDLLPLVSVQQVNSEYGNGIIDLTLNNPIVLSWNRSSLGEDVSHVTLMGQDTDYNSEGNPVLMEGGVLKEDVLNNGSLTINPNELRSFSNGGLSLSTFYLTPSSARQRRNIGGPLLRGLRIYSPLVFILSLITCEVSKYQLRNTQPTGLPPCPCNTGLARRDMLNFQEANFANFFFHPGADVCYRSVNSLPSGAGQQCCYGNDGNILVGPPGGGTADRYSPGDHFWKHQWYDVLPWLCLCKLSDNCNEYYKYRPSDDCSDYEPPRPAGGTGDPHLTSLDGYKFTFNGAGEFLMVSSDLHNLTFVARMERYRNTNASVYTAFVLQTNDSSKVQVQMSNMNETLILVDGEPLRLDSIPVRVHHLKGVRISFNSDLSKISMAFSAGIAVIVYIDTEMMSFIAQLDTKFQGQVAGLLGNLNGNPDDDLQFPNGTIMDPGSSLKELHEFGLQWLVKEDNSIFSYISPSDYSTYNFPEFSPTFEVPDVNEVSQEIKGFCGDSIECVFDAVVTGSLSFANETLMATNTINEVRKGLVKFVSCGFPGDVENGQMWGSVYLVNATVNVTCNENFTLEGSSRLTCQADGQWSSDLPVCVFTGDRGDAPKGLSAGVIAAIVVGTLIIVLMVAGVIYFLAEK